MSELDFDELDKAVNTLMGDVPRVEPPKSDDTKTLSINSTLPDTTRPSLAELNTALIQVNSTPAAPVVSTVVALTPPVSTPPLAARRGGRFMDVVHPSSDMKGVTRPLTPTSRQGLAIAPAERTLSAVSDDQSDTIQSFDAVPAVVPQPEVIAPSVATEPQATPGNDWPDPLEMSGYHVEPDTTSPVDTSDTPSAEVDAPVQPDSDDTTDFIATDTVKAADEEELQPLASPFITDAKVEKRPLGGAPNEDQPQEPSRTPVLGSLLTDTTSPTSPNDQLPANPADVEPQLPPELQSDLMAIETDGGTSNATRDEEASAVVAPEKPAAVAVAAVEAKVAPVVSGPTSIVQQYHEEPSTSDQATGSIYDIASYHQPLAHPVKKKSGWLWTVWILLLLIIGGGGAAALYFFDII